jgi:hypothetical protein
LPQIERRVIGVAITKATSGCERIAAYLHRWWRVGLAPGTIQHLLRRHGLPPQLFAGLRCVSLFVVGS